MAIEQFANLAQTTLSGAVTSGATALTVASAANFPASVPFRLCVDQEIMLVTALSGATFTVTRGYENTASVSHSNGAPVAHLLTAGVISAFNNHNLGHISYYEYAPSGIGDTADQTATLQNFLLYCQLQALALKNASLDDQALRAFVTAHLPRGYYNINCPLIVPELVNLKCDGIIVRNGAAGTITGNYTGDTTTRALANLSQPAVIVAPRGHCENISIYSNSDGINSGAGMFVGKNWMVNSFAVGAAGTGYQVGDVLTCAQPSKAPYIAASATVASVNGSGGVTGVSLSQAGAYALPPVLQAQQWTSANGFSGAIASYNLGSVFDGSGYLLTSGGYGTGATLNPAWAADWSGSTSYNMGSGRLIADVVLGHIRILQIPTTTDATYGPMTGFRAFGLNFTIEELQVYGGRNGIDFTHASDIRANIINSVKATNPVVMQDCSSINCPNAVIDTPSGPMILDRAQGIVMKGRWLYRNIQNQSSPAATIQCGLLSSGTDLNSGLNLTFEMTLAGSGHVTPSLAGNPALYLSYTENSKFDLNIDNNIPGFTGSQPTVVTSYVQFGANVSSSVELRGSIDYLSGYSTPSLFSGTNPGCGVHIWDTQVGGYAGPYGVYSIYGSGAPANGTSGTGAGKAGPGSAYLDYANKNKYLNTGTLASPAWTISGSVTSVGMTGDGVIFNSTVSASPVTGSGTLAPALLAQTKNTVLAGPGSGSNAAPAFRALVGADLPSPSASTLGGVQSVASAAHQWINAISTSGVPALSQPAASDISGLGTLATQASGSVSITGGTIDGTAIGATTAASGKFTGINATTVSTGYQLNGNNGLSLPANETTSGASIAIGTSALSNLAASANYQCTAIGYQALSGAMTTSGVQNTAIGYQALKNVTSGTRNIGIGDNSGSNPSSGGSNTFIGHGAGGGNGGSLTGSNNTGIAPGALNAVTSTGNGNTAIGVSAGNKISTGALNTLIGVNAGNQITTSNNNTVIGYQVASGTLATGASNILIGTSSAIDTPLSTTSNYLNIGGLITGTLTSNQQLTVIGAEANGNKSLQTPATGFSITVANNVSYLILDPSGTLATGAITTPAAPVDGQKLFVAASQTVTALTMSANTGQSIKNAPTAISGGGVFGYMYNLGNTTWYRIH